MLKSFSIPFNGDPNLLNLLDWAQVYEVYGAPTNTSIAHGRSRQGLLQSLSVDDILKVVTICEKNDSYFNLLLNSPYYTSKELFEYSKLDELIQTFSHFTNIKYTIAIPQIIQKIRKYSTGDITLSKFTAINNYEKLKRWLEFGIDSFIIAADITKNLKVIEKLCTLDVNAGILVNDPCLNECPISSYHFLHSSMHSNDETEGEYSNYCTTYCTSILNKNPIEILRSSFVRPEDLDIYKKNGVTYFKIVDRNKPTDWLKKTITSYINGSYAGNLLDLFPLFYNKDGSNQKTRLNINNKSLDNLLITQSNFCSNEICQETCKRCNTLIESVI